MKIPYIIATDFDGTICESKWPEIGAPNLEVIDYLKDRKEHGAKLILFTCREGKLLLYKDFPVLPFHTKTLWDCPYRS